MAFSTKALALLFALLLSKTTTTIAAGAEEPTVADLRQPFAASDVGGSTLLRRGDDQDNQGNSPAMASFKLPPSIRTASTSIRQLLAGVSASSSSSVADELGETELNTIDLDGHAAEKGKTPSPSTDVAPITDEVVTSLSSLLEIIEAEDSEEGAGGRLIEALPSTLDVLTTFLSEIGGLPESLSGMRGTVLQALNDAKGTVAEAGNLIAGIPVPSSADGLLADSNSSKPILTTPLAYADSGRRLATDEAVDAEAEEEAPVTNVKNERILTLSKRMGMSTPGTSTHKKNTRAKPKYQGDHDFHSRSSSSDPFENVRSHSKYQSHFGLRDSLLSGDHSGAFEKLDAMTRKPDVHQHFHGRRAADESGTLEDQCQLLVDCVDKMSFYDLTVYFYFDNIDFDTGEMDDNVTTFDDEDLFTKAMMINEKVDSVKAGISEAACNDLLSMFHRTEENTGGLAWKGGIVTEVCLASGTTQYLKLSEVITTFYKEIEEDDDGNKQYEGPGLDYGVYMFLDAMFCARKLFNAADRSGDTRFASDEFPFSKGNGVLRMPIGINIDGENRDDHGQLDVAGGGAQAGAFFDNFEFDGIGGEVGQLKFGDLRDAGCSNNLACIKGDTRETVIVNFYIAVITGFIGDIFEGEEPLFKLNEIEEGKLFDYALEVVFGNQPSVGKICGIANSVADETTDTTIPGTCCLDSPAESNTVNGVWGQPYSCDEECNHYAPYLAGMSVETCDVYGGKWCPNPTDCSTLKECVAEYIASAEANVPPQTAYAEYLKSAPAIEDETSFEQCGRAREYFGFEATFPNDQQICGDIEQLRNTRDFDILQGFFTGGGGGGGPGSGEGPAGLVEPIAAEDFTGYDGALTKEWRTTNYGLEKGAETAIAIYEAIVAIKCPAEPISGSVCALLLNIITPILQIIAIVLVSAAALSDYFYGEMAGTDENTDYQTHLNTAPIFDNMKKTVNYIAEGFCELGTGAEKAEHGYITTCQIYDEVLCRPVPQLLPGHGCDGVNNNCDSDHISDECDEDKYAPEISMTRAEEFCGRDKHVFSTLEKAKECLETHTEVVDDCYTVSTVWTSSIVSPLGASVCGSTYRFTVTAKEVDKAPCESLSSTESIDVLVDTAMSQGGVCEFSNGPNLPPKLDVSKAQELCGRNVFFQTAADATACVLKHSVATDDCRELTITALSEDVSNKQAKARSSCAETYEVTVTAQVNGCSLKSEETVLVLVDGNIPEHICDFTNGPDVDPALDVTRARDNCKGKIFPDIEAAKECVLQNSAAQDVSGGCRPTPITVSSDEPPNTCVAFITVTTTISWNVGILQTVSDPIDVIIDGEAPVPTCSFAAGATVEPTGSGVLANPGLEYSVSENCGAPLSVQLELFSNEYEDTSQPMFIKYQTLDSDAGNTMYGVFVATTICSTMSNGVCIMDPNEEGRRWYMARLTAKDNAGLMSSFSCYVEVGTNGGTSTNGKGQGAQKGVAIDPPPASSTQQFLLATASTERYNPDIVTVGPSQPI